MTTANQTVIESGSAAILNSRKLDTIVFESGNMYRLYGRKKESKLKLIAEGGNVPDFEHWDEYHFQRQYHYLGGDIRVVKEKRTLKLEIPEGVGK